MEAMKLEQPAWTSLCHNSRTHALIFDSRPEMTEPVDAKACTSIHLAVSIDWAPGCGCPFSNRTAILVFVFGPLIFLETPTWILYEKDPNKDLANLQVAAATRELCGFVAGHLD